jgi:hypothetical protein
MPVMPTMAGYELVLPRQITFRFVDGTLSSAESRGATVKHDAIVKDDDAFSRLERFFDQLRWFARSGLK